MDYYARLGKAFIFGILLSVLFSILFAQSFAVDGLQGPFVPIGIESVHTNGAASDVSVLYKATTTGGSDVYASAVTPFTAAEATAQAIKKSGDPNGGELESQLSNDGFNPNFVGDGFDKDIEEDDPEYANTDGTCMGNTGVGLSECQALAKSQIIAAGRFWRGMKCDNVAAGKVLLQNSVTEEGSVNSWGFWFAGASNSICTDSPGAPLPDPGDPVPTDQEMMDELSNPNPPSFPPLAPNPRPPQSSPPMLSPQFYSESSSDFFDMGIPTAGPSFSDWSSQLTADYDSFSSTTTTSTPLPTGMSFSPPPVGESLTQSSTGTAGTGEGEAAVDTCVTNPNSVGCADATGFIASIKSEFDDLLFGTFDFTTLQDPVLTEQEQGVAVLTPVSLASAVCPEPPSLVIMGNNYSFENSYVCDGLALMHPVIVLLASFSAALLIAGAYGKA